MAESTRTEREVREDLGVWERELDLHLGHCDVCSEGVERYCKAGAEISYMVTSLMVEMMRVRVRSSVAEAPGDVRSGS